MPTTLAIRFPLGQYHATPWDRSVNEGVTEWPPSPWRLLRALVATWHARWPELPAGALDGLLEALADPPCYRTPPAWAGHSRHYLPNLDYRWGLPESKKQRLKAEENDPSGKELTLDPFLTVAKDQELLVRWEADLNVEQRSSLAKLAELLPYLGRAESVCAVRLLEESPEPDETWWRAGASGARTVRLLAADPPVRRGALEMTTTAVRKLRRATPPGSIWVEYGSDGRTSFAQSRDEVLTVDAVRFAVMSSAPVKRTHGILLADAFHYAVKRKFPGQAGDAILGYGGAATDHQHGHWLPLWNARAAGIRVDSLLAYVPCGLQAVDVAKVISIGEVSGQVGGDDGYQFADLPEVRLLFQGAGPVDQVAPELCGPSRQWRSMTPYLPVRHRHAKRETIAEYLAADVRSELTYRNMPAAQVIQLSGGDGLPDHWTRPFRRYRMKEHLGRARPGAGLLLEFSDDVCGPLLLGQLSHFGYGIFVPVPT